MPGTSLLAAPTVGFGLVLVVATLGYWGAVVCGEICGLGPLNERLSRR